MRLAAGEPFDDQHDAGTGRTAEAGRFGRLDACRDAKQCATTFERSTTSAVGEESEVSDANQASGQNVQQEAAQELMSGNSHDLLLAAMGVVSPAEGDAIVLKANEAMVGDGYAMGIAGQVVENMFGAAEGWLGVDDPVLLEQLPEKVAEAAGSREMQLRAMKLQLVLREELLQSSDELTAEYSAQCVDGQEEAWRGIDPSGTVESQAAGGNDVVNMGMMLEVLSPGVEHAEEPYVGSEVPGIAGQFEHRRSAGAVEQIIEQPLVLEDKSGELVRQREDDVKVRSGQQFSRAHRQPFCARVPLALGAMPIAA